MADGDRAAAVADVVAAVITAGLFIAVGTGAGGALRLVLAILFVTFVPGWALLDYVAVARGPSRVAVAALVSLAICTIGASVMFWLGLDEPVALLQMLGGASLVALISNLLFRGALFDLSPATMEDAVPEPR